MLLVFFLNNSNKKMLAPHAVDIHSWNLSNYYLTMYHICRTIPRHFSLRQVKLCIVQRKYKQKFTTQGRINRPSEWIRTRSLNSCFAFCKIVVKTMMTMANKLHRLANCLWWPDTPCHTGMVHWLVLSDNWDVLVMYLQILWW